MQVRAREAGEINKSLLTLGRVIYALADNSIHVPYRHVLFSQFKQCCIVLFRTQKRYLFSENLV